MADDDELVLGGANDAESEGGRRFARVEVGRRDDGEGAKKRGKGGGGEKVSTGFEEGTEGGGYAGGDFDSANDNEGDSDAKGVPTTTVLAERLKIEINKKEQTETKKPPEKLELSPKVNKGIENDKDGKLKRLMMEEVTREIWLNNGAITSKRLMKKFDVGKKNPDRQRLFKQVVFELCTMQKDADGHKLVLKD